VPRPGALMEAGGGDRAARLRRTVLGHYGVLWRNRLDKLCSAGGRKRPSKSCVLYTALKMKTSMFFQNDLRESICEALPQGHGIKCNSITIYSPDRFRATLFIPEEKLGIYYGIKNTDELQLTTSCHFNVRPRPHQRRVHHVVAWLPNS